MRTCLISNKYLFINTKTTPIFYKYKMLKFEDIYLFELGKFIFQYQHKFLPNCLESSLLEVNQVHNYATHKANNLYVPHCGTNIC